MTGSTGSSCQPNSADSVSFHVSFRHQNKLSLFRNLGCAARSAPHQSIQSTVSNTTHPPHQATDTLVSDRILSIPDGYHLFRTDSVLSERMQDIRGVSGTSI